MPSLVREGWSELRLYVQKMAVDFAISSLLWISLFCFDWLTRILRIDGWVEVWIKYIHDVGTILAFALFGLLFVLDVIAIRMRGSQNE